MIDVKNRIDNGTQLVVRANQSMSWRANLWLAAGLGFVCMSIAIVLAFQGFWMIIPFAGAEVVFIVLCLYWTLRRLSRKEVITVDDAAIRIEWGYKVPDSSVALPRAWSRLTYRCTDNPFEVGELSVGAFGKRYALGKALGREEKETLYKQLKVALSR